VLHRSFAVVVLVLLGCACGSKNEAEPAGTQSAPTDGTAVLVTTDCGKSTVISKTPVDAGQTAMRALDRVADIEADSGGKFITAIEGREQNNGKKLAWLYYVNGKAAQKGATEVKLEAGDVEWWDLHNYEHECAVVPAAAK
jgi:Domain of unknown function (DUF4430)